MGTLPPDDTNPRCRTGYTPTPTSTGRVDITDGLSHDPDPWRPVNIVLCAAAFLYCGVTLFREHIYFGLLGLPRSVERAQLSSVASVYELVALIILLPVVTLVAYALFRNNQQLRRRIVPRTDRARVAVIFSAVAGSGLVLNNLDVWPFTWRDPHNDIPLKFAAMFNDGEWTGLGLLAVRIVVVVPVIEEIAFRYWLLQSGVRVSGVRAAGVLLSAAVFSVMHLGLQPLSANPYVATNAGWLFVFSVYFARDALSRDNAINNALIAHMSRNALEITTLLYAVSLG
jgi:membrane protease YdiL (CAAX protease family)